MGTTMTSMVIRGEGAELEVSPGSQDDIEELNSEDFEDSSEELQEQTLTNYENPDAMQTGVTYQSIIPD